VLVHSCSPSDRVLVQNELNQVTEQWNTLSLAWKKRKIDLDEVQVTAEEFHASYDAMLEWLDTMEQKLSNEPQVGTELEVVKDQLKVHKVSMCRQVVDTSSVVAFSYPEPSHLSPKIVGSGKP
jgi:hypothetical protein